MQRSYQLFYLYLTEIVVFIATLFLGYFLFSGVQKRPAITLHKCSTQCWSSKEIAGVLTSIGIQKTPFLLRPVLETDKAIAIKSPIPQSPLHYLIFPKKDIKNVAELSDNDSEYIMEVYALIGELIKKDTLVNYQVITNGPGYQHTSYLHFHLKATK